MKLNFIKHKLYYNGYDDGNAAAFWMTYFRFNCLIKLKNYFVSNIISNAVKYSICNSPAKIRMFDQNTVLGTNASRELARKI